MTIHCALCNAGYVSIEGEPAICPTCKRPTQWRSLPIVACGDELVLTVLDRRFLRSLKIAAD